jgi:hypothetical protein
MAACTTLMTALFEAPVAAVARYLDNVEGHTGRLDDRFGSGEVVSDKQASAAASARSVREVVRCRRAQYPHGSRLRIP